MERQRPIVVSIVSGVLGVLGAITLLAFPVGLIQGPSPDASWLLVVVAFLYGALAVAASKAIWLLSPLAPSLFLSWIASFLIFSAGLAYELPDVRIPIAVGVATGLLIFWLCLRYIRRACMPAV